MDEFAERKPRLQPFDEALWSLEDELSLFIQQAAGELRRAEAGGDAVEIAWAQEKVRIMFSARSGNVGLGGRSVEPLRRWFDENKALFEPRPSLWLRVLP
ncbi:hypothetical protein PRJ39_15935 [Lysobacter enzymogenes]|uniref:hypothetical protein n=1 Tax=Lysobacter enzymogenes TaxID=69 RepID=UPI0037499B03